MDSKRIPGKVIYIGSIPYDQTEEQILDIARSIGPVINLKMMFDKETGKSKGFAFIEYKDVDTASSAVRNLNNYSIGNRQLKCDFSSENTLSNATSNSNIKAKEESLPPLPQGITLPSAKSYAESIATSLNNLDPQRLNNIVRDLHLMANKNPFLLQDLLNQCPQLSYSMVEILLRLQKVDTDDVSKILVNQPAATPEHTTEELDEEQLELIKQVIRISDEDLAALPEEQKASILEIKENYRKGLYGNLI